MRFQLFVMRRVVWVLAIAILASSLSLPVWGQAVNAEITGLVTDPTGAVISDATVSVISLETGLQTHLHTNADGFYQANELVPGNYRIEVQSAGFAKIIRTGIELSIGQVARVDVQLSPGVVSQSVVVNGDAPLLQTETNEISQNIDVHYVANLPVLSRDPIALTSLVAETNPLYGTEFQSIAGSWVDGLGWYVDGVMAENRLDPVVQQARSVTEDMEEMRVTTNDHSTELSGTAVVQFQTKSGSNKWKGEGYYYGRNDVLNAAPWGSSGGVTPAHTVSPGFNLGGPIKHDRLFFYVGYNREVDTTSGTDFRTVPTALQRTGDFSQTFDASGDLIPIYDPSTAQTNPSTGQVTRSQFPGNMIPQARFDAVGANLLKYIPAPNLPGNVAGFDNWEGVATSTTTTPTLTIRLDQWAGPKGKLFYRIMYQPQLLSTGAAGDWPAESDEGAMESIAPTFSMAVGFDYTFTPSVLASTRFGFTQRAYSSQYSAWNPSKDWPAQIGLNGVEPDAFPVVSPAGYDPLVGAPGVGTYYHQFSMRDWTWAENISWLKGAHSFAFGGEVQRSTSDTQERDSPSGSLTFSPLETGQPGVAGTGNSIASMLLGSVDAAALIDSPRDTLATWYYALYFNDRWKLGPKFTLTYGVRWETSTPFTERSNQENGFDPTAINPVSGTPGSITYLGVGGVPRGLFQQNWLNFSPTVGVAWTFAPKTVFRGGASIIHSASLDTAGSHWFQGATFGTSIELSSPDSGVTPALELSQGFPPPPTTNLGAGFGAVPVGQPPTFGFNFWPYNRKLAYNYEFNLGVEHELRGGILVEASYLSSLGRDLYRGFGGNSNYVYINVVPPSLMGPGNTQSLRPFPQYGSMMELDANQDGTLNGIYTNGGRSSYNALKLKVEKHFSNGLGFMANYVYSRFKDDFNVLDEFNPPMDYWGLSALDLPQKFAASVVYDLPFGDNKQFAREGIGAAVLGGWSLSSIFSAQSGRPLFINPVSNTTNAFSPLQGVDQVGDPHLGHHSMQQWFNQDAYSAAAPYTYGDALATVIGPGSWDNDLAIMRNFTIHEDKVLQFRWEAYNWLNHPNLVNPGVTLGAPGFGVVGSKSGNRLMQYAIKFFF